MHFFQFAITVIAIIVGGGVITAFIKTAMAASGKSDQDAKKFELTAKRLEKTLDERLEKIESRLANVETLVVEEERTRKFDAL